MKKLVLNSLVTLVSFGGVFGSTASYAAKEFLNVSYDPTREFYQDIMKILVVWKDQDRTRY